MKPHVICVGDVMIDVVATLPGPLTRGSDTPAPISLIGGGAAANAAAWLAAGGMDVTLVARVGDDALGRQAQADLAAAGVDPHLVVDARAATGSCIVLVDVSGERTMIPDSGANARLSPADVEASLFAPGRHLHLSAYSLFHDGRDAALRALELARGAGMSISVDAASSAPLAAFGASRFADLVGGDLLLLANQDEAGVLTGVEDPHVGVTVLGARFSAAVVKLGADGALWSDGSLVLQAAAVPVAGVEPVRTDTTGAGDAFAAGLLAARLSGARPLAALQAGNRLAARACAQRGARP